MAAKKVTIESETPHVVSEVICINCQHRWIAVRPEGTMLSNLHCPNCGKVRTVIETGEELFDENGNVL